MRTSSFLRGRGARIATIVAVSALVGAGITYAAVPATNNGRITACYATSGTKAGLLRIIDSQIGVKCAAGEKSVNWQANGVRFMKAYASTATYVAGDVVTYGGASFIALTTNRGITPAVSTRWGAFAAKGATGATGATGPQGKQGFTGPQYGRVITQVSPVLTTGLNNNVTSTTTKADGTPIIAFVDNTGALGVASCIDPTCARTPVVTKALAGGPSHSISSVSITIGNDGLPGIAYTDFTVGKLFAVACTNIDCTAVGTPTTILASGFTQQADLNSGGVIAYGDSSVAGVQIRSCSKVDCSALGDLNGGSVVSQIGGTYTYPKVALGAPGAGYVVAYQRTDTTTDARMSICKDTYCFNAPKDITLASGTAGWAMQLAIGNSYNPIVAYFDSTANTLQLELCADSVCTTRTTRSISATNADLNSLQLTLTPEGVPVLAYVNNGTLTVVQCDTASCAVPVPTTVTGATGLAVSGAVNGLGRPVYAFIDGSNQLRTATITHGAWTPGGNG